MRPEDVVPHPQHPEQNMPVRFLMSGRPKTALVLA
jgi:hypothetical protein